MALPINIDDLINARTVESVRIEFKRGWNPYDILRTVCAFTNDIDEMGGGYVIVGVEEKDGTPILPPYGVEPKEIDGIQREFFKLCNDDIDPKNYPSIEVIEFQGKYIIAIWVTTGEQRPYSASISAARGAKMAIYVRHGSITKEASKTQERQLRELAAFKHFDDRINNKASIDDLDLGLIQSYLQEINSNLYAESVKIPLVEIATRMQIARGSKENIRPLNVGLLMFCREPHRFFEGCKTNLIEFEDESGVKYSENIFTGPVHVQIRDIMSYLKSNIIKQHIKKPATRPESVVYYNYPYQALEEVIVNALYHRSYEEQRPNEIRIYKGFKKTIDRAEDKRRIEVRSYPGPLPPLDSQALAGFSFNSRNYRNIKLGDWLKNIRLAEKYATGVPTILKTLSDNGSPPPLFWTDDLKSEFLVTIKTHEDAPYNNEIYIVEPEQFQLKNIQQQILELLVKGPLKLKMIKSKFNEDISKDMEFLIKNNYVGVRKSFFTRLLFISQKGIDALKSSF